MKMASVLLIYPPLSFEERAALSAYAPPLGILYLASVLEGAGHRVRVVDAEAERLSLEELGRIMEEERPEVVGITCLTLTLDSCKRIVREARRRCRAYVVVGGPHISVCPPELLGEIGADAYVVGEAEGEILRIVEERPRGLIRASEPQDLDSLPLPARRLVEHVEYGQFYGMKMLGKVTGILTTRGCRYGCTYCNRPKKLGFRARSPRSLLEELKLLDREGFDSIWIADDNFTNDPRRVIKLAELMKEEGLKFHFFGQARVDTPSRALYRAMREMGVLALSYGVESVVPRVVRWYAKTPHPERWPEYVRRTLELCKEHDIIFLGSLIFGAPMETREDMERSIEFLERGGADFINGNILLYMVGSAIWNWARREGKLRPDQFVATAPELGLTPYSREELQELCNRCADFSKREGWKSAFRKILGRREMGLIWMGVRRYVGDYLKVRRVRREIYGYGYGKRYTTKE
jgi:radical SAM superfamily enzyme YgiQ (UPF0313 family)